MAYYQSKALSYFLSPTIWERFRDDIFDAQEHGAGTLPYFLHYLNNIDKAGKTKFTLQIADEKKLQNFQVSEFTHVMLSHEIQLMF